MLIFYMGKKKSVKRSLVTPAVLILHSSDTYRLIQFIQQWAGVWQHGGS